MRKNPLLIFTLVIGLLTAAMVIFIQSPAFARIVKRVASQYIPKNVGIEGDFESLSIQLFPPGIALVDPRLDAKPQNVASIPAGTHVAAERIELSFRPFQMLSGKVSIHEVRIVKGIVRTSIVPGEAQPKKKKTGLKLSWEDLIEVRAENLAFENTRVELDLPAQKISAQFNAKKFEIESHVEDHHPEYDIFIHLDQLEAKTPADWKYPNTLDSLRVAAKLDRTGLNLKEFELVREGTQMIADGLVAGDVLKGSGLKADLNLKVMGDLARMLDFLSKGTSTANLPKGHVAFEGRATADLDRLEDTIDARGTLQGENVVYGRYQVDRIVAEGSYAAGGAGKVQITNALLEGKEIAKQGGNQPGLGGKVEVGAFSYTLGSSDPIEVSAKLTRAHIHWIGAGLLESFYSLDGRITGETQLKFTPPTANQEWNLGAQVKWNVEKFQIDNQRFGVSKPLSRIVAIPAFALVGDVSVDPNDVKFSDMTVQAKTTRMNVFGGIGIGENVKFDIQGAGPVDLEDFTVLAENTIRGKGGLSIHVHGPAESVLMDFDGDIQDFYYLKLYFGAFRGRVTWDDSTSFLKFQNLDCIRNRTKYRIGGHLDLTDKDLMNLAVSVPSGNIHDFLGIFQDLTKSFWWFPQTLTGNMKGEMKLTGGIGLDRMVVDASMSGDSWEYYGERFRNVSLRGGYDRGKYFISDFQGQKRNGKLSASISYDTKEVIDWKIAGENLTLLDFDHLARLDVPIRGKITGQSQGKGPPGAVESNTIVKLDEVVIRGQRQESSSLTIQTKQGKAIIKGIGLGGQAQLDANYDFNEGSPSYLRAQATDLDFAPIILLLNPTLIDDETLVGRVSGSYQLNFQTGKAELGSGSVKVADYLLAKRGTRFRLAKPQEFRIDRGTFQISDLTLLGDDGQVSLAMRSDQGNISGTVQGKLDLGIAEFVTSSIGEAAGAVTLDLGLRGTLKKPELYGRGNIVQGMIRVPSIETPIENLNGKYFIRNWDISVRDVEADFAGGRTTAEGTVEIFTDRFPKIDLAINLFGNKMKVYPFQVAKVRGKIGVKGDTRPYLIDGRVLVENAVSREKISNARGPGFRTAQYTPPPTTAGNTDFPLFVLDIAVSAPGNIIMQNELLDLEAKGDLKIVGTLDNPRPTGVASSVQGKLLFKDRVFQIQSGNVEFDNPTVINPRFEVIANTELNNRKIQMFATGRFDKYRIEFTSNPPMPENEILSFLALGVSNEDSRRFRTADRSAYEQSEAASLVLHSLDFNREVENKTGFQIAIDEASDDTAATSAFRSRAAETDTNSASPKIVIRRKLGNRVDLSFGSTVGVGTSQQREVSAEVKMTNSLSVQGIWNRTETQNQAEDPVRNSYGVDLKVQRRFK